MSLSTTQRRTFTTLLTTLRSDSMRSHGGQSIAREIEDHMTDLNNAIDDATAGRDGSRRQRQNAQEELDGCWAWERSRKNTLRQQIAQSSSLEGGLSARIDTLARRRSRIIELSTRANDQNLTPAQRDQALTQLRALLSQRNAVGTDVFTQARDAYNRANAPAPLTPPTTPPRPVQPTAPPAVTLPNNTPADLRTAFGELNTAITELTPFANGVSTNIANDLASRPNVFIRRAMDAGVTGMNNLEGGLRARITDLTTLRNDALAAINAGNFDGARALLSQTSTSITPIVANARDGGGRDADRLHAEAVQTTATMENVVQTARSVPGRAAQVVTLIGTGGNTRLASLARRGIDSLGDTVEYGAQLTYGVQSSEQASNTYRDRMATNVLGLVGDQLPPVVGPLVENFGQSIYNQTVNGNGNIDIDEASRFALNRTLHAEAAIDFIANQFTPPAQNTPLGENSPPLTGNPTVTQPAAINGRVHVNNPVSSQPQIADSESTIHYPTSSQPHIADSGSTIHYPTSSQPYTADLRYLDNYPLSSQPQIADSRHLDNYSPLESYPTQIPRTTGQQLRGDLGYWANQNIQNQFLRMYMMTIVAMMMRYLSSTQNQMQFAYSNNYANSGTNHNQAVFSA